MGDLGEGQAGALLGHVSVGGGADERVAQRPQEVGLVHRADREGDRLLGGLLRGDHREEAHPRRLGPLPLGGAAIPQTMSPIDGASKLPLPLVEFVSSYHGSSVAAQLFFVVLRQSLASRRASSSTCSSWSRTNNPLGPRCQLGQILREVLHRPLQVTGERGRDRRSSLHVFPWFSTSRIVRTTASAHSSENGSPAGYWA
jgi:hypothetical protein